MPIANVVLVGTGRAGTTSLFRHLVEHPSVCGSSRKETHYFDYARYGTPAPPLSEYMAYFDRHRSESIILEASPGYFSDGRDVATEIARVLGEECRIVVTLREPISRLISYYTHAISQRQLKADESLESYVERCRTGHSVRESKMPSSHIFEGYYGGFYRDSLLEWFEVFGSRVRVVFFEDIVANPLSCVQTLATWMGIDPEFYDGRPLGRENASHVVKNASLQRLALWLNGVFEPAMSRSPHFARVVRNSYLSLNTRRPSGNVLDHRLRRELVAEYRRGNLGLGSVLNEHGYTSLPEWIGLN